MLSVISDNYRGLFWKEILDYKAERERRSKAVKDAWDSLPESEKRRINREYLDSIQNQLYKGRPAEKDRLPFVGMTEKDIDKTAIGTHTSRQYETKKINGKDHSITTYYWGNREKGKARVIVHCEKGEVTSAYFYYDLQTDYDKEGYRRKGSGTSSGSSGKTGGQAGDARSTGSGKTGDKHDAFDVYSFDTPEDFADEWAEEFGEGDYDGGWDDAFSYWEDHRN